MRSRAGVVQRCKDTRRSLLLDQIADDLVVEVVDWSPFDLFADVFFLLGLQGELNEDLLQFFIDVIDAELLKRVVLADDGTFISCERELISLAPYKISNP